MKATYVFVAIAFIVIAVATRHSAKNVVSVSYFDNELIVFGEKKGGNWMLERLKYDIGTIPFEGYNVFEDEYRMAELHKANQLWKDRKYKGALLYYDSVISSVLNVLNTTSDLLNRIWDLRIAYHNKLSLLQKLYRANKLWSLSDCKELLDLYDSYIIKFDEIVGKCKKKSEYSLRISLDSLAKLLIEKGKLVERLSTIEVAMPLYEKALDIINAVVSLNQTDDGAYYEKGTHLSRMNKNDEAIEALSTAQELSTNEILIEKIEEAIESIQKGRRIF